MSNDIVDINASVQQAAAPSQLQRSGAFVTQGGTNTPAGTKSLLTQFSDLAAILGTGFALTALAWSDTTTIASGTYNSTTGLVTLTLAEQTVVEPGSSVTITGATGTGTVSDINGTFTAAAGSGPTTIESTIATGLTLTISGGAVQFPGMVTATASAPTNWGSGKQLMIAVSGCTPAGYNGVFEGLVTGSETVIYPLASNPGSETVLGNIQLNAINQLIAMATTFYATKPSAPVYVVELGVDTVTAGVASLATYIQNNLRTIYAWLTLREWDANPAFITLAGLFTGTSAFTYFYVTTTVANRTVYAGLKSVLAIVEAPVIPPTEFSLASQFAWALGQNPSSVNKTPPMSYAYTFGTTPYPLEGNQTIFTELKAANVGWIGTGYEGGISNTIVYRGQMSDGKPWNFWYGGDWLQINMKLNLANEIINGSNSNINPLYYNQPGVNRLQGRAVQTGNTGISNGLVQGQILATRLSQAQFNQNFDDGLYEGYLVINAEPFITYSNENPGDYAEGIYGGISGVATPLRGFSQIIFNLELTDIIAGG